MANNRIQIKRTSTAARTPNTSDPANTQYIAPGELALNMTDKILYTSDGSSLITIGATQTTITATTVNLTDNITIGDIGSSQLIVNSTAVFAGNNTVNSSVNTTAIAVRDPDHYSAIAADIIAVSNNTSNSKVTPALIFVGNSAANAQFNMIGGSSSLSISSYSYDTTSGLTTFTTSTAHNFTTPLRGTVVTITGLTGVLASVINGIPYEVASIPTTTSFTIRKNFGTDIKTTARTSGVATLTMGDHTFAVGQSVTVKGAGTDTVDATLTYDGTYTITANSATTLRYNNAPAASATVTSMFVPYTTSATGPITYVASAGHPFTTGKSLFGTISTTANSTITYIGYKASSASADANSNRTGNVAYIATSASVANIYSTGMQLDVLAPSSTVASASFSWTATVTKITASHYYALSGKNYVACNICKLTLVSDSSSIPAALTSTGYLYLYITGFTSTSAGVGFGALNRSLTGIAWQIPTGSIPAPVLDPLTGKYTYIINGSNGILDVITNIAATQSYTSASSPNYGIGTATVSSSIEGVTNNYGGGTVVSTTGTVGSIVAIPATGTPTSWTATITGMSKTDGIIVGSLIWATPGTGSTNGGKPYSAIVTAVTSTTVSYKVTTDTNSYITAPTAGTITNITTPAKIIIQDPVSTTAILVGKTTTYANSFFVSGLVPGIAKDFSYSQQETRFGNSSVICFPTQTTTNLSTGQKVALTDNTKYLTSISRDPVILAATNHNWRTWTVVSPGATFTASVADVSGSKRITASSVTGTIAVGQIITGAAGTPARTYITQQLSGTTGGAGVYELSQYTGVYPLSGLSLTGALTITPDDSEIITSFQQALTNAGLTANTVALFKTNPEFIPLTALSVSPNKTYFTFYKNYDKGVTITYVNSTAFTIPYTTDLPKLTGNFGNSSSSVAVSTGTLSYNTDKGPVTAPAGAKITAASISTTSVTGVTASTNFSSYVEIANSSAAIKMTPTTFYIGNTSANLFSNSSFLGISSSTDIFQASPNYLFIGKAENGIPTLAACSYVLANSTNFYIGNGSKFTVFDGAGNQINKGSSITVGTEYSNVYIDNYTVEINNDNSQTLVNTSIASFSGNVVIVGPLSTNGTYGQPGDVLYSSGEASYWAQPVSITDFVEPIIFSNTANFDNGATFNKGLTIQGNPIQINYSDPISVTPIYNTSTYSHDALTINTTNDLQTFETVKLSPNTLQMVANNAAVTVGNSTINTIVNSSAVYINGKFGFANSSTSSIAYTYYNASANSVDTIFG